MPAGPQNWSQQQQHYTAVYAAQLPQQLARVTALVRARHAQPAQLAAHFDSCLALLDRAAGSGLQTAWLDLVAALHPLPLRWRRWDAWGRILVAAAEQCAAARDPAQEAHYRAALADLRLQRGRLDAALTIATTARALAAAAQAPLPLAQAGSTAVSALRFQARNQEAACLLDEVRAQLAALPAPRDANPLPAALLDLEQMDLLRAAGELEAAVALARGIMDRLAAHDGLDAHQLAAIYRRRATIYWAASRYPAAAADLEQSAALFEVAGDPLEAIFSRGNLGLVYYGMARYDDAENHIRAVIAAAEAINAQWRLMRDLGNLAAVYLARGQLAAALVYARRQRQLAERFGDTAEASRAAGNEAAILMYQGHVSAALPELQAAHDRYRAQQRPEGYLSALADLAVAAYFLGDAARGRTLSAELLAHPTTDQFPMLRILGLRARALHAPPPQAADGLTEALALARQHGRRLDEAGCLLALSALAADASEQARLWSAGADLLAGMGATAWLDGHSPADPPLVALLL